MKLVRRIVLIVIALVLVVVLGGWAMIDGLTKTGIEKGGEIATGVPTTVQTVNLSLLKGTLLIDTLNIANPTGYSSPHMMKTGTFDLEVKPGSVFSNAIEVPKFELNGLDVNIESKDGKNNISAIMEHIQQMGGEKQAQPAQEQPAAQKQPAQEQPAGEGKKVKVNRVVVKNVVAHVYLLGGSAPLKIEVPEIVLENVSSDDNGATVSQLMSRILPAILASIVEKGKGIIPADLAGSLSKDISGAANAIGGQASKLLQQTGSGLLNLGNGGITSTSKAAQDIQKGLTDPLKGLLGGEKKK